MSEIPLPTPYLDTGPPKQVNRNKGTWARVEGCTDHVAALAVNAEREREGGREREREREREKGYI